jgi:hypothetical protein
MKIRGFGSRVACLLGLAMAVACAVAPVRAFDHRLLDAVLKERVAEGRVDYAALKTDRRLEAYLDLLANAEAGTASLVAREEQLAFWINAYNAVTLKLVADHYPVNSIKDVPHPGLPSPWDLPVARVAGRVLSLNDIEHAILRAELKEPRIHYAVVCAAVSCPQLRSEAYVADRLEAQVTEQARLFLSAMNRFDVAERNAELSRIFEWFAVDFGGEPAAVLRAVAPYAPEAVREELLANADRWTVTYLEYDWALNERRP